MLYVFLNILNIFLEYATLKNRCHNDPIFPMFKCHDISMIFPLYPHDIPENIPTFPMRKHEENVFVLDLKKGVLRVLFA